MQTARRQDHNHAYELYRIEQAAMARQEAEKKAREKMLRDKETKRITQTIKTYGFFLFVFAMLAVTILRYAALYEVQYKVNDLSKEIDQTNMEIEEVRAKLDNTISLDNVERVAMSELGMQYPKPEQIVYIDGTWHYNLNKQAKSNQTASATNPAHDNLIQSVYDYIMAFAAGDTADNSVK